MTGENKTYSLIEGYVDILKEHVEIHYRDETIPCALVAPGNDGNFFVHFLPHYVLGMVRKQIVEKDIRFYLLENGDPNPWQYAIYHATFSTAEMYSDVHWRYYEKGREPSLKGRELLLKIANCKESCGIQSGFLPEPWDGWIDMAPVLYIASNPSTSKDEDSPTATWENDRVADFFANRFSLSRNWTQEFTKYRTTAEIRRRFKSVKFWKEVLSREEELVGTSRQNIIPGTDYSMTEIVHCKSKNETGVSQVAEFCCNKYLDDILTLSPARVVILLGKHATTQFDRNYGLKIEARGRGKQLPEQMHLGVLKAVGASNKLVAALRHPGLKRYGEKITLQDCLTPHEIIALRDHLSCF
jgi:hypothetical protein